MNAVNQTHWNAGLMCINPEQASRHSGIITRATHHEGRQESLQVTLKIDERNLEGTLVVTGVDFNGDLPEEDFYKLCREAVREVYDSFEVENSSLLVGKRVEGIVYSFGNQPRIIGFRRDY